MVDPGVADTGGIDDQGNRAVVALEPVADQWCGFRGSGTGRGGPGVDDPPAMLDHVAVPSHIVLGDNQCTVVAALTNIETSNDSRSMQPGECIRF